MPEPVPLLSCRGVSKRFGPVAANQAVDLDLLPGRIHAVLGENGAGKSTLMSILAGRYRPDAGEMRLDGRPVSFASPAQALRAGIGMVYQRFMLVETLTVAENVLLGAGRGLAASQAARRVEELSARYGLAVEPRRLVRDLSMGERQRVEILKLLMGRAKVLILDEPTSVLTPPEIEPFFATLRRLRDDGRAIAFITHKLEEVLALADSIHIMRRGRMVARLDAKAALSRRELARLMVGREIVLQVDKPPVERGDVVLRATGLAGRDHTGRAAFQDVDLELRRGEVLALVGVAGNGQDRLTACLGGMAPFSAGFFTFMGRDIPAARWPGEMRSRLAYVPEDRYGAGSVASMSLADNYLLTNCAPYTRSGFLDSPLAAKATERAIQDFRIRAVGPRARAGSLSGGNLQKLILARELGRDPNLFIAEQPTQGLDVAATEDIWQALLAQRARSAVLLVTGDLREALSLADRVAVMFRGRILETVDVRDGEAVGRVGLLMAGVREEAAHAG